MNALSPLVALDVVCAHLVHSLATISRPCADLEERDTRSVAALPLRDGVRPQPTPSAWKPNASVTPKAKGSATRHPTATLSIAASTAEESLQFGFHRARPTDVDALHQAASMSAFSAVGILAGLLSSSGLCPFFALAGIALALSVKSTRSTASACRTTVQHTQVVVSWG